MAFDGPRSRAATGDTASGTAPAGDQRQRSHPVAKAVIIVSLAVIAVAAVAAANQSGSELNATDGAASENDDASRNGDSIDATTEEGEAASLLASMTPPDEAGESISEPIELDDELVAGFARDEIDVEEAMAENLAMIKAVSVRNRNHDASPWTDTPSDQLVLQNHYGPRSEYLNNPAGNPEQAFPVAQGGQFRTSCEFSHFAYDDPLVHPGKPGASHLHMYFGNTNVNAYTTYETLLNSGSSTCNGQELNRTGYWAPAMFDGKGNVRVPERVVVYYKGENLARGRAEVYPPGAAMIATENLNVAPTSEGGIGGIKQTFVCSDNFSTPTGNGAQTIPACDGSQFGPDPGRWTVMEMSIKFPQCWNGSDPSDWTNFSPPVGDWYVSRCEGAFSHTFPNLEYFVNYRVEPGENTADWFLASDVDPVSFSLGDEPAGATSHADWWGGWHPEINRMWIDNCVNYIDPSGAASGCGMGYLTDGGPDGNAPYDGPTLKYRPQYEGPSSVSAETLFGELCPKATRSYTKPADAAYCTPGSGDAGHSGHMGMNGSMPDTSDG